MRSETELSRHLARKDSCNTKFLILEKKHQVTLFGEKTYSTLHPAHLKCKSYFCPICVKAKQAKYITKLKEGMKKNTWRFLTLTTNKNVHDTDEAIKNINIAWNAFATVLRRNYKGIKYFKVLEISENNSVHLHLIINKYIPVPFIVTYWKRYWESYIVKIKPVETIQGTLNYILKYVFKSTNNFKTNKIFYLYGKRRFSFSHSWDYHEEKEKLYTVYTKLIFSFSSLIRFLQNRISEGKVMLTDIFYDTLPDDLSTPLRDTLDASCI